MASGPPVDKVIPPVGVHAKPAGNVPVYPSPSVTVHVPYGASHGQVSSPTIQHRPVVQGPKVGQTTAVIQKAAPAVVPNRAVPLQTYQSKYGELLNVIEDLGREIKPTYAGSKMAQERLKKGIMHARTLVRECLLEVDKSSRQ